MKLSKTVTWLVIFTIMSLFTWQVGIAYGIGDDYVEASVPKLNTKDRHVIYFEEKGDDRFKKHQYVCSITNDQYYSLVAAYDTETTYKTIHGKRVAIATVEVKKKQSTKLLKNIVGKKLYNHCQHRECKSLFFIFTVPGLS